MKDRNQKYLNLLVEFIQNSVHQFDFPLQQEREVI
jgi:hypothetical protein